MSGRHAELYSPAIGSSGSVVAYGHWGRPVLAFPPVRRLIRPLFLHAGVTSRLGIDRNSDERQVQQAVERLSGELRVLENTGRVPFTARKAVLLAQQSLDRIHAELAPYL